LPSYVELCARYEAGQWGVHALDFAADRHQWRNMNPALQEIWLRRVLGILRGEVAVNDALAVYMSAITRRDQSVYVATQIADETRHVSLFERFQREVIGVDNNDIARQSEEGARWTSAGYRKLVAETLPALCSKLRADQRDAPTLIAAVTLLHFLIEGGLGMARLRTMEGELGGQKGFPGLRAGLSLSARDEVRHFLFGLRFLHDAVQKEPTHGRTVVRTVADYLPAVLDVLGGASGPTMSGETPRTLRRLERGLQAIGLSVSLAA
jgi:ribonucleoside-diphosphate reductase beta chain